MNDFTVNFLADIFEFSGNTTLERDTNDTTTTATESEDERPKLNLLSAVVGTSMATVTLIEQIIVFVVFYYDKRLQKPSNYYMIALAIADCLLSVVSMPVWTMFSTIQYWPTSQLLCDIWNVLDHVLTFVSIHIIVFISVERYRSIKYPLEHMTTMTGKRIIFWLTFIWIVNIIFWTFYIFITQYIYGKERNPLDCTVYYTTERALVVTHGIVFFMTPVLITAIVYTLIYRIAKKSGVGRTASKTASKRSATFEPNSSFADIQTAYSNSTSVVSNISEISGYETLRTPTSKSIKNTVKTDEKERKALKTIALLLVTFAICWLPFGVYDIVEGLFPGSLNLTTLIVFYWMGYANSMINPLCYAAGNPQFRESLRKLFTRKQTGFETSH